MTPRDCAKALVVKEGLLAPFEEASFDRLLNAASRTYLAWECQRWLVLLASGVAIFLFTRRGRSTQVNSPRVGGCRGRALGWGARDAGLATRSEDRYDVSAAFESGDLDSGCFVGVCGGKIRAHVA